jgi:hypothetical protein
MSSTTTDFGQFHFGADIGSDDRPFIGIRPVGKNLDVLDEARLFLRLRDGVNTEQAEALADRLNELIEGIEYVRYYGGLS